MKIVNIFLSILVFLATSILLYQIVYFEFVDTNKIDSYIGNIKLTDKVNLEIKDDNYFINNINKTYRDLLFMKYGYKDIKEIEKDSNINLVFSTILIDKFNHLKSGKEVNNIYSKNKLDNILICDKFSQELKDYIISNDYKIIEFENRINSKVNSLNNHFQLFRFFLDKISLIITSLIVLIFFIYFIITKKYSNFFVPVLMTNFFNIVFSVIILALLNTKFEFTIVNYFFYDFIIDILKKSVMISVIVILLTIIFITLINKKNKKNEKLKPRIRKEIENEEDFSFGL